MGRRVYKLKPTEPKVAYRIEYDKLLNEEQRAVVFADSGPMLVLAGAGTGKTRTLTYRVARLIESGVDPSRILLLTFTNKAAREMVGRVESLLGGLPQDLWGGTFHHVGNRILRNHADLLGYPGRFNIIDTEDAQTLMGLATADANINVRERRFPRPQVLCKLYSLAINTCTDFADAVLQFADSFSEIVNDLVTVFKRYETRKVEAGVMDYDDLLNNLRRLFNEHEDVWKYYSNRFEHVLVDEYQDTNTLQGDVVEKMAANHKSLMVVGDDCQSIYRFRGADYRNILEFPKRHANTRIFKLQTNYRSTQQILDVANASIRFNKNQYQKQLKAVQPDDEKPVVIAARNVQQQAQFVAQRALELRDEGVALNEIAVLYRAHYHSMELQVELTKRNIPFIVRSGVRFFEQRHIKDVLSYLRLVHNPRDEVAFSRIMQMNDGVGRKTSDRIWRQLKQFDDISEGWHADGIADALPKRAAASWDRTRRLLIQMQKVAHEANPGTLVDRVLEDGYTSYLRKTFPNADVRRIDIEQLANFAGQSKTLNGFLADISLQSAIAAEDVVEGGELDEHLVLTSVHQAKGLEFKAVFLIWLADGRFPSARSEKDTGIDEERRLFYVAVTRAKTELYMTYPMTVRERERGMTLVRKSQFVEELPSEYIDEWVLEPA